MSAADHLNSQQFQFNYRAESIPNYTTHVVTAHEPEHGDEVGHMAWADMPDAEHLHGEIQSVWTQPDHRRRGVASGMYAAGRAFADLHGVVAPRHSEERTHEGDQWAKNVSPKKSLPPKLP